MTAVVFLTIILLAAGLGGLALILNSGRSSTDAFSRQELARLRKENEAYRQFLRKLDKTAYDHRAFDSELSIIIIDEISSFKEKELP